MEPWNLEKYKAISQDALDYASTLSICEKESLSAEAKLRVKKPFRDGSEMSETKVAIEKLQRIQELWRELGRTASSSPEYETRIARIRVLSGEYQALVDSVKKTHHKMTGRLVSSLSTIFSVVDFDYVALALKEFSLYGSVGLIY